MPTATRFRGPHELVTGCHSPGWLRFPWRPHEQGARARGDNQEAGGDCEVRQEHESGEVWNSRRIARPCRGARQHRRNVEQRRPERSREQRSGLDCDLGFFRVAPEQPDGGQRDSGQREQKQRAMKSRMTRPGGIQEMIGAPIEDERGNRSCQKYSGKNEAGHAHAHVTSDASVKFRDVRRSAVAIAFVRTRYDRIVSPQRLHASPSEIHPVLEP